MIGSLRGTLLSKEPPCLVVEACGVDHAGARGLARPASQTNHGQVPPEGAPPTNGASAPSNPHAGESAG